METSLGVGSLPASASLADVQEQQARQLAQQAASSTDAGKDAKIDKAAQQFEAILVGTWLREAEQSFATAPGEDGDADGDSGGNQMMSMGVQSLSEALAQSGGIGIAKMIAGAMHAAVAKSEAGHSAASGHPARGGEKGYAQARGGKGSILEGRSQTREGPPQKR